MGFITLIEPLAQLAGTGVMAMGIMNWIGGDDGSDPADVTAEPDGGDQQFDDVDGGDAGGDPFGDADGDPFAEGGSDPFDDAESDPFGDTDDFGGSGGNGSAGATEELEERLDDLESEVARISSVVDAVRSENEELAAGVDETEENVRKLLEVYEMVTRGVNPFVEGEGSGGVDGLFGEDDFGLFDDGDATEDSDPEADAEIGDAFDDEEPEEPEEALDEETEQADELDDSDEESNPNGTTFEDLKAEYESDDAERIDDGSGEAGSDEGADDDTVEDPNEFELADERSDDEFEYAAAVDPEPADGRREPYLVALPDGYRHDIVVLEWLDSLASRFGAENAVRAIDYYVEIGWISEAVGDHLRTSLDGLVETDAVESATASAQPVEMDAEDHVRSLTFITNLAGDAVDRTTIERRVRSEGFQYGLQC